MIVTALGHSRPRCGQQHLGHVGCAPESGSKTGYGCARVRPGHDACDAHATSRPRKKSLRPLTPSKTYVYIRTACSARGASSSLRKNLEIRVLGFLGG